MPGKNSNLLFYVICTTAFLKCNISKLEVLQQTCTIDKSCYGSSDYQRVKTVCEIKPESLSKETCFNNEKISFKMGTDKPLIKTDGESPSKRIELKSFCIDQTEVSNRQYYQFVVETNYKTEAEKQGDSFCLINLLSGQMRKTVRQKSAEVPWWVVLQNATWFNPEGIDSNIYKRWDHPVIHISWNDADAYCRYFNKRLPTEAEWEFSCRGGLDDRLYPWGNNPLPKNTHMMNIWQGNFPEENLAHDGYSYTSPVGEFNQNKYNMKNIVGNVWEWTDDWWRKEKPTDKVKKGGSFMCHPQYCHRYRCAARSKNTPDTSASNIGFRCARNI